MISLISSFNLHLYKQYPRDSGCPSREVHPFIYGTEQSQRGAALQQVKSSFLPAERVDSTLWNTPSIPDPPRLPKLSHQSAALSSGRPGGSDSLFSLTPPDSNTSGTAAPRRVPVNMKSPPTFRLLWTPSTVYTYLFHLFPPQTIRVPAERKSVL